MPRPPDLTWAADDPGQGQRPQKRRRDDSPSAETGLSTRGHVSSSPRRSLAHILQSPSPPVQSSSPPGGSNEGSGASLDAEDGGSEDVGVGGDDTERASITGASLGQAFSAGGDWTYTLEVIQQPQRARACGFGDKDRRPLSPPPIIRLWVRTSTGEPVDPSHVNVHFLVLMVDLWSADGIDQRNVVMHPASQSGRSSISESSEFPLGAGPSSRPSTSAGRSDNPYAFLPNTQWRLAPRISHSSHPTSPPLRSPLTHDAVPDNVVPFPRQVRSSSAAWTPLGVRPGLPRTQSHGGGPESLESSTPPVRPMTAPSTSNAPPVEYPLDPTTSASRDLPSIASITHPEGPDARSLHGTFHLTLPAMRDAYAPTSSPPPTTARPLSVEINPHPNPEMPNPSPTSYPASASWHLDRPRTAGVMTTSGLSTFGLVTSPYSTHFGPQAYPSSESSAGGYPHTPEPPRLQLPPSAPSYCSRVLVGSLTAICQRLQDENGQTGYFFFAHDLGIRTEGVFSLKFTLTNLSSLMQPSATLGDHAMVIAETYSTPFTVYSAKRFPGVIPTTNLTRLFARQNVRLPTRQKRARGGSPAEVESGEAEGDDEE